MHFRVGITKGKNRKQRGYLNLHIQTQKKEKSVEIFTNFRRFPQF